MCSWSNWSRYRMGMMNVDDCCKSIDCFLIARWSCVAVSPAMNGMLWDDERSSGCVCFVFQRRTSKRWYRYSSLAAEAVLYAVRVEKSVVRRRRVMSSVVGRTEGKKEGGKRKWEQEQVSRNRWVLREAGLPPRRGLVTRQKLTTKSWFSQILLLLLSPDSAVLVETKQ